jgi:hypothetical protein
MYSVQRSQRVNFLIKDCTDQHITAVRAIVCLTLNKAVAYPGFFWGGVQQIQLRTEGRENRDLGAVAP